MSSVLDDLRFAVRSFARAKVTTAVLLLSLAVGTGANAALYSVIAALLFDAPAGVVGASRLARVFTAQFNGGERGLTSYPDYLSLKTSGAAFESLAAFDDTRLELVDLGTSRQRVRVVAVSGEFFATLGMAPHAGRLIGATDDQLEKPPAVISHALWTIFGQPGDIVGRAVRIGARDYRIAGIAPSRFSGLQLGRACDAWIPLATASDLGRGARRLSLIGRLRPDGDVHGAHAQVSAIAISLADRYPDTNRGTRTDANEPRRMSVSRYARMDGAERAQVVLIGVAVLGASGLLLVSACVNAGTLLLSRSAARRRELAVKLALGASRRMLARQTLVESLAISLAGAGLGLLLAYWTAGVLPSLFAPDEADMLDTSLDVVVVSTTIAIALLAGGLFAIGPARHATQTLDIDVLRADAGGLSERAGGAPLRALVVTGQVALSTVMLIAAGLLVRALTTALEGDLGPGGRGVAVALLKLPGADADDALRMNAYYTRAAEAARKLPGAEAVGWVTTLPVGRNATQPFQLQTGPGLTETVEVDVNVASAGYFQTMRIAVVDGRPFNREDGALSKPVAVINDILARQYFGARAVGHELRDFDGNVYEIVGVVRSGKYRTFQEAPEPMVYFPLTQRHQGVMHLVVRTAGTAEAMLPILRDLAVSIDGGVDVRLMVTFEEHLQEALSLDRLTTNVVAGCGLMALVLATIGVYGVIADAVRRRTPEIGLRLALGASASQVVRLVFGEGLHLTMAGAMSGVCAAIILARVVRVFVHGLPPVDVVSLAVAPIALFLVVLGAAALPTLRALRISPTIALRADG